MTTLKKLLTKYEVNKGSEYTHTSIKGKSYYISSENIELFYSLYTSTYLAGEKLYLTEKRRDITPVTIDLDFRHDDISNTKHLYNHQHLHDIVYELIKVIDEYLHVPEKNIIYLLTKPARICKKIVKDGIHIIIPNIVAKPNFHEFLRNATFKTIYDILRPCGYTNKADDIYDKASYSNNWLMYGSKKPDETTPWTVTTIYLYDNDQLIEQPISTITNSELPELFSIRNKYNSTPYKLEIPEPSYIIDETVSEASFATNKTIVNPDSFETVSNLVSLLSEDRAYDYHTWIRVGWCLHNINDSTDYLKLWDDFSKKTPLKYKSNECAQLWQTMRKDGLGIGTLCRWAKEDSPEEYNKSYHKVLANLIYKSVNESHHDIARVVYHMYKEDFASIIMGKNVLCFHFDNHRWVDDSSWSSLKILISTEVVKEYLKLANFLNTQKSKDSLDTAKKLLTIALKLKSVPFKANIIKECIDLFRRDYKDFFEKLDTKDHLIGFQNGVYDLNTYTFRPGHPDDLITFSTKYDFPSIRHDHIKDYINQFIQSITSSNDTKQYILDILSYACHGNKKYQDNNLNFWSGSGANGKGSLKNLCVSTFGDYAYEPDPSIITTGKSDSSRASPELARLKGKRFVCSSEPERDQKLQVSMLKRMTGGDQIQARELYKENVEFKLSSVLIVLMNNKPALNDFDGGIVRRLNIVDFPFKFVDKPILHYEKQLDLTLDERFNYDIRYVQEFMMILLENYKNRIQNATSIKKPSEIQEETSIYLEDNNIVKQFISKFLIVTNDKSDMISSSEMFAQFKESELYNKKDAGWFKEQMATNGLKAIKKTTRGQYYNNIVYFGVQFTSSNNYGFISDNDELEK